MIRLNDRVSKQSLDDQVYRILRNRIVTLQFGPGEQINISKIAKELGASNTPVRHALSRLYQQGWVEHTPNSGYQITKLSEADVSEIYETRKLLETQALEKAIRTIDSGCWAKLLVKFRRLSGQEKSDKRNDSFRKFDEELHKLIMSTYNTRMLKKLFDEIFDVVIICQRMSLEIDKPLQDHILLLESLLNKDRDKAKDMLTRHIEDSKRDALRNPSVYFRGNRESG